ncbi:helix-turn-helix domain-containing protein [uncultured Robinsoniella sp.]|uniref:helix-turn-helix domain-containing protein n=1 Tax=uncultured Robinsoniella sp. TaxID=904190 RepID=UPI00374F9A74
MVKQKTSIRIIMELLDISLDELADYLHIDRTTISKWRTGRRKLLPRSPYFEQVLSYFTDKNNNMAYKPLNRFLCDLYPDEEMNSPQQIHKYLKLYLSTYDEGNTDKKQNTVILPAQQLFVGIDGRKKAFDFIISEAEKMVVPGTIKILEFEQVSWISRDIIFLQNVVRRLFLLAERGFHIEFAFSSMQNKITFWPFIGALNEIRFHKNINMYVVDVERIQGLLPRIYAVADKYIGVGLDSYEPTVPMHTNLFTDPFNTHKYCLLFDHVIQLYGSKVLATDSGPEIDHILDTINYLSQRKGELLFYSNYLSITTMSESLLLEILNDNHIKGKDRERCLFYCRTLRQAMTSTSSNLLNTYNLNLDSLEKALSYEYLIEYELSALTNRQIRKTPEQYTRHLLDTVEFLESNQNIKLLILAGGQQFGHSYVWLKRNLWSISFNTRCVPIEHQVIFWDDISLVNWAIDLCTQFAKNNYSVEHRQKEYNLEILRSLGNRETI